jgi:hypothetical protein
VIDAASGRPEAAREQWKLARPDFGDHHMLAAFTLLDESRDVAVTFGAADPTHRRSCAAEAEAALERAVGVLQPGAMPRLAWLRCLVLDGRWDEALQILDELPPPENNYLRRESTFTRAVLARHRGQPELAWVQIRPLFPEGAATEPGNLLHQEALSLQRIAAELCLDAGDLPGSPRTTGGLPGMGACWAGRRDSSLGPSTITPPATMRGPDRISLPRSRTQSSRHSHWSGSAPISCSGKLTPHRATSPVRTTT